MEDLYEAGYTDAEKKLRPIANDLLAALKRAHAVVSREVGGNIVTETREAIEAAERSLAP